MLAKNIAAFVEDRADAMEPYSPQTDFLALMMTGDGKAVGAKFGIAFTGKWVWGLKDYIDVSFMNLFNKHYLFHDYDSNGYEKPVEENSLYEEEKGAIAEKTAPIKERMNTMTD